MTPAKLHLLRWGIDTYDSNFSTFNVPIGVFWTKNTSHSGGVISVERLMPSDSIFRAGRCDAGTAGLQGGGRTQGPFGHLRRLGGFGTEAWWDPEGKCDATPREA